MSNRKNVKLLVENWRLFINEQEQTATDPKKEAEQVFADLAKVAEKELASSAKEIEGKLQQGKQQQASKTVQEEGFMLAAGVMLAMPVILKLISKVAKYIGPKIGLKMKDENFLDHFAHDAHEGYISFIEKGLMLVPSFKTMDAQQRRKLADVIFNAIIATVMLESGIGAIKAAKAGHVAHAGVEGALTAIKEGELAAFIAKSIGRATA